MQWTECGNEDLCRMLHPSNGLPRRLRLRLAGDDQPTEDEQPPAAILHMEDYPGFLRRRVGRMRSLKG